MSEFAQHGSQVNRQACAVAVYDLPNLLFRMYKKHLMIRWTRTFEMRLIAAAQEGQLAQLYKKGCILNVLIP
jgi:hypothetical protein